ncbi:MAG: sterol desaturase/sphingolipid hydroxylase (fatty acid hydroxylase superfamily) [Zhongshania aliphaticivorans]
MPTIDLLRGDGQAGQCVKRLFAILINAEIPEIGERYRRAANGLVLVFALGYSIGFLQLLHLGAYLGPGLGDIVSFQPLIDSLTRLYNEQPLLYYCAIGLLVFTTVFRLMVMLAGYFFYQYEQGQRYPIQWLVVFLLCNMLATAAIPAVLFALAILGSLAGVGFSAGWHWIELNVSLAEQLVMHHIPTLIDAPAPLAVVCIAVIAGFFHYWFHRLGHHSRLLWLLFHRPHHMTPGLVQSTTLAVFSALPLFVFLVLPYNLVLGACTKLFSSEPLYTEVIIYNALILIPEIFGHQTALYRRASRSRIIRVASFITGGGVYHYMHHSSEPEHCGRSGAVNLVNLGGGPMFIWDIIFGTYCPLSATTPRVGLSGQPRLHMNPLRLALAGIMQLSKELMINPSWTDKWHIVAGSSAYQPPRSLDYAIRHSQAVTAQITPCPHSAGQAPYKKPNAGAGLIASASASPATEPQS